MNKLSSHTHTHVLELKLKEFKENFIPSFKEHRKVLIPVTISILHIINK